MVVFYHYELQWSPSIKAAIGEWGGFVYNEVSLIERVSLHQGWPYEGFHCTLSFSLHRNP